MRIRKIAASALVAGAVLVPAPAFADDGGSNNGGNNNDGDGIVNVDDDGDDGGSNNGGNNNDGDGIVNS